MSDSVTIELKGFDELIERLSDIESVLVVGRKLVNEAAEEASQAVIQDLEGRGTGMAARSIRVGPDSFDPFGARVYTLMSPARTNSMIEGRPPGASIPMLTAARWVLGRPNLAGRRLRGLSQVERSQVIEAVEAIRSGGAKPIPLREKAAERAEQALEGLLDKGGEELVKVLS